MLRLNGLVNELNVLIQANKYNWPSMTLKRDCATKKDHFKNQDSKSEIDVLIEIYNQ